MQKMENKMQIQTHQFDQSNPIYWNKFDQPEVYLVGDMPEF